MCSNWCQSKSFTAYFAFAWVCGRDASADVLTTRNYCLPQNTSCWPSAAVWEEELGAKLSSQAGLYPLFDPQVPVDFNNRTAPGYIEMCESVSETNPNASYILEDTAQGRCMQYQSCARKQCDPEGEWNIPQYSVMAKVQSDVVEALKFAAKYNIQVAVKTSGHNYAGSSLMDGGLLIWMRHYEKYGDITREQVVCGTQYIAVMKVGGGQNWYEAYRAAGNDYHMIGGGGLSVGAAGGWLMGGGLSASARRYGMGVDQVVQFEVVLADGRVLNASACENEDLFWAMRGGGGGSFGVTTAVWYRLHETKPFCEMAFYVNDFVAPEYNPKTINKWLDLLVDEIGTLDRRWGGYWTLYSAVFYYEGTYDQIVASDFLNKVIKTFNYNVSDPNSPANVITFVTFQCAESYFALRGGPDHLTTDQTGQKELNIASRLIPTAAVADAAGRQHVKEVLQWMVLNGFSTFNYIIGGAMNDVGPNATAVHPVMRASVFQMETFDERLIQKLREEFPDSAIGFNHAARNEPNFDHEAWGPHLPRLLELKDKYDPTYRFNCYHCLRYLPATPYVPPNPTEKSS